MKVAQYQDIGTRGAIPQEVRRLRKETLEFHRRLGTAVILKHKWNEEDVAAGHAQHCPYCRDEAYQQGRDLDPNCFGTGYLGGFADGIITFMTMGDALEDIFRINAQGLLMRDSHPICTAPWTPKLYDGDIIITGEFDPDTWDPITLSSRYELREVTPVAPRGGGDALTAPALARSYKQKRQNRSHLVSQNFQIDKLPYGHPFYQVPAEFDYVDVPEFVGPGPGMDPDEWPEPIPSILSTARIVVIKGGGGDPGTDDDVHPVFPPEEGMTYSYFTKRDIRIEGEV